MEEGDEVRVVAAEGERRGVERAAGERGLLRGERAARAPRLRVGAVVEVERERGRVVEARRDRGDVPPPVVVAACDARSGRGR